MAAEAPSANASRLVMATRLVGWANIAILAVFLINNFLTFGWGYPGAAAVARAGGAAAWFQFGLYAAALLLAGYYVFATRGQTLRADADRITAINYFIIRAAFFGVVFVGVADLVISFLRVEGMLSSVVGDQLARNLARSQFSGQYVHMPLLGLGIVIAMFTRTLGFIWLALLIVAAELLIVFSRFIFSYEQAFMGDLVRFWYGALFLFASAYTLMEEGHVRVDVFYAAFSEKTKGAVNAIGTLVMGLVFCWTILFIGMGQKSSIINAPIFGFETSPTSSGMYIKYLMAAFLGIFAITMLLQFVAFLFIAVADWRRDPGHVEHEAVRPA